MIEIITKLEPFAVTPYSIKIYDIELTMYVGTNDTGSWLNSLYYGNISIDNTDALFIIINNAIINKNISL